MHDKSISQITSRIKKLRQQNGMTQSDLAKKAGLNTNSYAKIERGERTPSIKTLEKLFKALGVKSSDVLPF